MREEFGFEKALAIVKAGGLVARAGWNGKGMHIEIQRPDIHSRMTLPYLFLFTTDSKRVPWLASQTDLLAEDWYIVS